MSIIVDEAEDLQSMKVLSVVVSFYSTVEEKQIYYLLSIEEITQVKGKRGGNHFNHYRSGWFRHQRRAIFLVRN